MNWQHLKPHIWTAPGFRIWRYDRHPSWIQPGESRYRYGLERVYKHAKAGTMAYEVISGHDSLGEAQEAAATHAQTTRGVA